VVRSIFVISALMTFTLATGLPASDSLKVYQIDEIVVTATRLPVSFRTLPISMDVVRRGEIDLSDANSATDAIASLPGVFVERTGDFGRVDVSIRGLGNMGRRLSVLMDGHPVKMGLFGCTITHALPLSNISRIEVIRAPASVLYGSDALGGIVNIVTSSPPARATVETQITYGSFSTTKYHFFNGATLGSVGYTFSVDRRQSDGHLPNSAYEGTDVSAKIAVTRLPTEVTFFAKYFDGYKEEPALATDPPGTVSDVWNDYRRGSLDLEMRHPVLSGMLSVKLYDEFGEHEFSDGWHSRDHSSGLMAHATWGIRSIGDIDCGLDVRRQSGDRLSEPEGSWSKIEYGAYVFSRTNLTDRISTSVGVRLNSDEISGQTLSPHAGIILRPDEQTSFRVSTSRGFRSPQLNELYLFPSSNEDLSPEIVWSYEVGVDRKFAGIAAISLAGFLLKGSDFIELVRQESPPPMYRFENSGSINFRGAEVAATVAPLPDLQARLSYSYFDPGEKTRGRPGNKLNANIAARLLNTNFTANFEYVGKYYAGNDHTDRIASYTVLDVRVAKTLHHGLGAFFSVKNLLDEDYQVYVEIPGGRSGLYEMPGRRYLAGLTFEWKKSR